MENQVLDKLREIVGKKVKHDVEPSTKLADLGFDSLDKAEIIINIEDEFGIEFSEDEMLSIKTVGDFIGYIEEKTKE